MLLCAAFGICSGIATASEPVWRASAADSALEATLSPEAGSVRIGQYQNWLLQLSGTALDPNGTTLLRITGGMPEHGHGLPTRPQFSATTTPGQYRIEGLRFNMQGNWLIIIDIVHSGQPERLTFELALNY